MPELKIVFFDLDGVFNASSDRRKHLVPQYTDKSAYWSEWHKAHVNEPVNPAAVYMLKMLHATGHKIVFLSSRQDTCLDSTHAQISGAFVNYKLPYLLALRGPLDDSTMDDFKAGVIGTYLYGVDFGSNADRDISVLVIDDSKEVLDGIATNRGINRLSRHARVTINYLNVAPFKG